MDPTRWHHVTDVPEALWLSFNSNFIEEHDAEYPFAIKIATGKINAVTGDTWQDPLKENPQDYIVAPEQPWLDGYCVEKGFIRQFVAMPLGTGYSAEEQVSGEAKHGGLQVIAYPMKKEIFKKLFPKIDAKHRRMRFEEEQVCFAMAEPCSDMGLAPGGRMEQEIYEDPFDFDSWETNERSRCFVHIANSLVWRDITNQDPPSVPFTGQHYNNYGLPWFEYYSEKTKPLDGSKTLKGMKSIIEKAKEKKDKPLPENASIDPVNIKQIRKGLKKGQVREGIF